MCGEPMSFVCSMESEARELQYLAENSSKVSSSWPPLHNFAVVLKLPYPPNIVVAIVGVEAAAAHLGIVDRTERLETFKKLVGALRVARRSSVVEDIGRANDARKGGRRAESNWTVVRPGMAARKCDELSRFEGVRIRPV